MGNVISLLKRKAGERSTYRIGVLCLLLVVFSLALFACSGQSTTTTTGASTLSVSSSSSYDAVAEQYEDYSSTVSFDLGLFRSSSSPDIVTISGESENYDVEAASIQVVILDAYDNPLGTYDLQYNQKQYGGAIASGQIRGAKGAADVYGIVYAYKLSDGTVWGNSKASSSEIEKYGHRIEIEYY